MSGQATAERVARATETAAEVGDRIRRRPRIAIAAACLAGAITAVLARRRR
nr:hypothetical protein [uncultured Actinoplanes sp.]